MPIQSIKSGTLSRSTAVGNAIILPGDFESIATVTLSSASSSIVSLTSIPQTFTHLQIRHLARSTRASGVDDMSIKINGSANAGAIHNLNGNGATVSAFAFTIYTPAISYYPTAATTASVFSGGIIDILDYKDTNKYKTVRTITGFDANGSGYISLVSNLALTTSAVTSIDFTMNNGDFAQYSSFALYGIRG